MKIDVYVTGLVQAFAQSERLTKDASVIITTLYPNNLIFNGDHIVLGSERSCFYSVLYGQKIIKWAYFRLSFKPIFL